MEAFVPAAVGILLMVLGYLIAFRQKIGLVHSYHYKRVAEEDKPAFCKGEGIGNIISGVGAFAMGLTNVPGAHWIGIVLLVVGIVVSLATVIRYNHGLF